MLLPSSNSPPRREHHQQRRRRKLLLTSCIISTTLLLLTSSLLLPNIALVDVLFHTTDHINHNNDIHSTNSNNSSSSIISLEEWIKLQKPAITSSPLSSSASATFDRAILKASNLTNEQIAQLSYDTSCLSNLGHRVYNALYLVGRHRLLYDGGEDGGEREGAGSEGAGGGSRQLLSLSFASENNIDRQQQQQLLDINNNGNNNNNDGINSDDDEERYNLRGGNSFPIDNNSEDGVPQPYYEGTSLQAIDGNVYNRNSVGSNERQNSNEGQNINRRNGEGDVVMQRKTKMMSPKSLLRSSSSDNNNNRKLDESSGGWSTHTGGSETFYSDENEDAQLLQQHIEDYVTGEITGTNAAAAAAPPPLKDEDVTSAQQQQQQQEEEEDEDLYQRMEEVMRVTQSLNEQYGKTSSSSPTTTTTDDLNNNNNNNNPESTDTMTQYSLLSQSNSERQRLLTGYYATWQWYDRSNLASPSNLKLNKVSRINYAFFQSDTDGYIFGTDSWADPNVLNGPYDFSISRDDLPSYCQGGRGRDDGKPQLIR